MTMLPKVVDELCADEPAAANHDDLHMFIHIAGAERFAFHNGSSIRQVVIFVSHRLSVTAIHEMNDGIRYILTNYGKQMRKIFAVSSEKSFIRVSLFPLRAYRLFF